MDNLRELIIGLIIIGGVILQVIDQARGKKRDKGSQPNNQGSTFDFHRETPRGPERQAASASQAMRPEPSMRPQPLAPQAMALPNEGERVTYDLPRMQDITDDEAPDPNVVEDLRHSIIMAEILKTKF